ncbi:MAG: hypothetical protein JRD47_12295 [Deltaproteobacteria bacterium]|nr:hypothetical protein [Deltaproteobacteria bacterium]
MDFKKHIVRAWELTLKFIVSLVLMTLVMSVVAAITLGILAPTMMAGYMQSILSMVREGREPRIQDLFSEMRLFLPLLAFGIIVLIGVTIGKKLGLVEAIKQSYNMAVRDNIPEHIVVVILFLAISGIGSSFLVGFLFTQPLATTFLLSVYYEKTANEIQSIRPLR